MPEPQSMGLSSLQWPHLPHSSGLEPSRDPSSFPAGRTLPTTTPPGPPGRGSKARGRPDLLGSDAELQGRDEVFVAVLGDGLGGIWEEGEREAHTSHSRACAYPVVSTDHFPGTRPS